MRITPRNPPPPPKKKNKKKKKSAVVVIELFPETRAITREPDGAFLRARPEPAAERQQPSSPDVHAEGYATQLPRTAKNAANPAPHPARELGTAAILRGSALRLFLLHPYQDGERGDPTACHCYISLREACASPPRALD